jgi:hypothetical protein
MSPKKKMSQTNKQLLRRQTPFRTGFTLVEMLVSVSLVLLMMLLFTEMFQLFSGAVTVQQGVSENNERSRTLSTTIKADLAKRTFFVVSPFAAGERYLGVGNNIDKRRGYFYVSENNPVDDTDDVLAFTVLSTLTSENKDETPYVGRANLLGAPINGPQWEPDREYTVGSWVVPQNPIQDAMGRSLVYRATATGRSGAVRPTWDGNVGTSTPDGAIAWTAVVANANQPDSDDGVGGNTSGTSPAAELVYFLRAGTLYRRVMLIRHNQTGELQPIDAGGNDLLGVGSYGYAPGASPPTGLYFRDFDYSAFYKVDAITSNPVIRLHGFDSLNNRVSDFGTAVSLGMPYYRFGHMHRLPPGDGLVATSGRRREFVAGQFIGGFTHEESSHQDFDYPRQYADGTSPMMRTNLTLSSPGRVTQYVGGTRRAEDILMTNVRSFDVKLWDPSVQDFVDVGRAHSREDANGNSTLDPGEDLNGNGVLDLGVYHPSVKLARNSVYGPMDGGSSGGPPVGVANRNVFDTWHPQADSNSDGIPDLSPYLPSTLGPDGAPGVRGVDDDGNGITDVTAAGLPDFRELGASGSDDVAIPVRAIKITIRFEDPGTEQLRQISIVHSLVSESGL